MRSLAQAILAQAVVAQNAARSGDVPSLEAYFPRGSDKAPNPITTKRFRWPSSFSLGGSGSPDLGRRAVA